MARETVTPKEEEGEGRGGEEGGEKEGEGEGIVSKYRKIKYQLFGCYIKFALPWQLFGKQI